MAYFAPFRALRPAKKYQSQIPALPYDVYTSSEAAEVAKGNPISFLHVDMAEIDFDPIASPYEDRVYLKAAENLKNLEADGYMRCDAEPCFYIYRQIMGGRTQTGIAGCASIDDYLNDVIKKHEKTLKAKEQDRLRHVDTCNANTGPIFLTYKSNERLNNIVDDYISKNLPEYDFVSGGVQQTVWVIADKDLCYEISGIFEGIDSLYIADGHHRCRSAVDVGLKRRKENPGYTGTEEFNRFLAVAFPDSELKILPYYRVIKSLNKMSGSDFIKKIKDAGFELEESLNAVSPAKRHTFGLFISGKWYEMTAKKQILRDSDPVEGLDVSLLQNNIFEPLLGIKDPKSDPNIDFVGGIRGTQELERRVNTDCAAAFSTYPTTVEELMKIADSGLVMPPKSTWFEPKLLSGLFVHKFDR